ncbi:hypothetical protein NZK32_09835 [Cyanobium sp. FGCU-52]|nr:hypothetical protein [Cyanobium sp. FGCU52]
MQINPITDFDKILWKQTLWINFLRPLCALPALIAFSSLTGNSSGTPLFFVSYPLLYLFLFVPILLLIKIIAQAAGGPLAGLLTVPLALIMITGGDPIVFIISKVKPDLVPIQNYPILSFDLAMFVLK